VDEQDLGSDLLRRSAAAVKKIPADRIHVFCASCAERFFVGYGAWLAEEMLVDERAASLPSPEFVRRAIDACWEGRGPTYADDLLRTLIRTMPTENEQVGFTLPLQHYFIEPWLLKLGLSCVLDPQVSFGLEASAAALDFHWQLLVARTEMAGGPAFDDPEFDRQYQRDPGALAESAIQTEDAQQLERGEPDIEAMRKRSADHGRHALDEVKRLFAQP
jgi:hypothetical protein